MRILRKKILSFQMIILFLAQALTRCVHQSLIQNFVPKQAYARPYPGRLDAVGSFRLVYSIIPKKFTITGQRNVQITRALSFASLYIGYTIKVDQMQISVPATDCLDVTFPAQDVNIPRDADLYLYVVSMAAGNTYYANAVSCYVKSAPPKRPLFGRIVFNSDYTSAYVSKNFGFQILFRVALHQTLHALGFSESFYAEFVSKPTLQKTNGVNYIVSPKVMAQVNSYYGCSNSGMPLQDGGSSGSAGSHWQKQILNDQIMTAQFSIYQYMFMSSFTLALLEDSGFYSSINYNVSEQEHMTFGRSKGCTFITSTCNFSPQVCPYLNTAISTYYKTAMGRCGTNTFFACRTVNGFDNRVCVDQGYTGVANDLTITLQYGGAFGMAFQSNIVKLGKTTSQTLNNNFRCFQARCFDSQTLIVTIGTKNYTCKGSSGTVSDPASFNNMMLCPDVPLVCKFHVDCQNRCSKQAVCVYGKGCTTFNYSYLLFAIGTLIWLFI